jgi:mannitol-1-phosphate/altronate dehydrogenase
LCKKWQGTDELFTADGFKAYAENLLVRMTNPFLKDAISRITRDLPRKLSWDDRVIGTMRVVLSQDVEPAVLRESALLAVAEEFGSNPAQAEKGLRSLWNGAPETEQDKVLDFIFKKVK